MRKKLLLKLRFKVQATDGVATGYVSMFTYYNGDLPAKGERIRPCSGDSHINMQTDVYSLEVVAVCRNVGGDYHPVVVCEVTMSDWNPNTGMSIEPAQRSKQEIKEDWHRLSIAYDSETWNESANLGTKIVSIAFDFDD